MQNQAETTIIVANEIYSRTIEVYNNSIKNRSGLNACPPKRLQRFFRYKTKIGKNFDRQNTNFFRRIYLANVMFAACAWGVVENFIQEGPIWGVIGKIWPKRAGKVPFRFSWVSFDGFWVRVQVHFRWLVSVWWVHFCNDFNMRSISYFITIFWRIFCTFTQVLLVFFQADCLLVWSTAFFTFCL